MPWQVELVKNPLMFPWKSDYFPRRFHYKKDAKQLKERVEKLGGEAEVKPAK